MRIEVHHSTTYRYADALKGGSQYLRLTPLSGPGQEVLAWQFTAPGKLMAWRDHHGNSCHSLTVSGARQDLRVQARGLVMASDSRTNAGVDRVSTFRKMFHFEVPGEHIMCLVTAGNLSITQAVVSTLGARNEDPESANLGNAATMVEAAPRLAMPYLKTHGVAFAASMIFAGQVKGEAPRLFRVYEAGNFIEACGDTPYFQIGETKYGKPIRDRLIPPRTSLEAAAKCALVSIDSTMRSNISVGPPIDFLALRRDSLSAPFRQRHEENHPYLAEIRQGWGEGLKQGFNGLRPPEWRF